MTQNNHFFKNDLHELASGEWSGKGSRAKKKKSQTPNQRGKRFDNREGWRIANYRKKKKISTKKAKRRHQLKEHVQILAEEVKGWKAPESLIKRGRERRPKLRWAKTC